MTTWDERMTRRPTPEPTLVLLETCWQLRSPSGRILTCAVYQTDAPGVEVRAGYSDDDLIRSQHMKQISSAREVADTWKELVLARGGYTGLSAPEASIEPLFPGVTGVRRHGQLREIRISGDDLARELRKSDGTE